MGEAKRRGTKEQRQQQAVLRETARRMEWEAARQRVAAADAEARAKRIAALPADRRPAEVYVGPRTGGTRLLSLAALALLAGASGQVVVAPSPPPLPRLLEDDTDGR